MTALIIALAVAACTALAIIAGLHALTSLADLVRRSHRCPHGVARCTADNLCADCWGDWQW